MEINVNANAEEIMRRVNLKHISKLVLDGKVNIVYESESHETYEQRLHESSFLLLKRLKNIYKDDENALSDTMLEYETAMRAYSQV